MEGWRKVVGRAVMRLEVDPVAGQSFCGEMLLQTLPEVR
jgi:hypothetical protein